MAARKVKRRPVPMAQLAVSCVHSISPGEAVRIANWLRSRAEMIQNHDTRAQLASRYRAGIWR